MKNIGYRIEKARKYRVISRTDLGKAVGFPVDSAYRRVLGYEKGERVPKEEILKDFAKALKIDYDWFMFDEDFQIGNISYFENSADPTRKKHIKQRLKTERTIYDNLHVLSDDELQIIINMINSHGGNSNRNRKNPSYGAKKKKN